MLPSSALKTKAFRAHQPQLHLTTATNTLPQSHIRVIAHVLSAIYFRKMTLSRPFIIIIVVVAVSWCRYRFHEQQAKQTQILPNAQNKDVLKYTMGSSRSVFGLTRNQLIIPEKARCKINMRKIRFLWGNCSHSPVLPQDPNLCISFKRSPHFSFIEAIHWLMTYRKCKQIHLNEHAYTKIRKS